MVSKLCTGLGGGVAAEKGGTRVCRTGIVRVGFSDLWAKRPNWVRKVDTGEVALALRQQLEGAGIVVNRGNVANRWAQGASRWTKVSTSNLAQTHRLCTNDSSTFFQAS